MAPLFERPVTMILYCPTQEIYSFIKFWCEVSTMSTYHRKKKKKRKVRFWLDCSLVVILIISSTCPMNVFNFITLVFFFAHSVKPSLHLPTLAYVFPWILKLESICFQHMHLARLLLVTSLLSYELTTLLLKISYSFSDFLSGLIVGCGYFAEVSSYSPFDQRNRLTSNKNRKELHKTEMSCPNQFADTQILMK